MTDERIEEIAEVCHAMNRLYCMSLGDGSQVKWKNAPEWQRTSAINGVKAIIENPDLPPSASHEDWYDEKAQDGWVYGKVKDPEKKQHPCMVPYHELPADQKAKDTIFGAVVRGMMG